MPKKMTAVGLHIYSGAFTLGIQAAGFKVLGQWEEMDAGAATFGLNFPDISHQLNMEDWPIRESRGKVDLVYCNPPCVVEGTRVQAPLGVFAVMRRWYEGEVIELEIGDGNKATITPNHPILTDKGWVSADLVQEGDYVLYCGIGKVLGVSKDEDEISPRVEDLFDSVCILGGREVAVGGAANDFYSDGRESQIDVVTTDGLLRMPPATGAGRQALMGDTFDIGGVKPLALVGKGSFDVGTFAATFPDSMLVSMDRHSVTTFGGQPSGDCLPAGAVFCADRNIIDLQQFADVTTTDAKRTLQSAGGLAQSVTAQELGEVGARELALTRGFVGRPVMGAVRKFYAGHVYNLHSGGELYAANGIITHNCAPWSVMGSRLGMADPRVVYTDNCVNAALQIDPDFFVWESVCRAYTQGREKVDDVIQKFYRGGYAVTVLLTNAVLHGAPQSRERFHFIAHRYGLDLREPTVKRKDIVTVRDSIEDLEKSFRWRDPDHVDDLSHSVWRPQQKHLNAMKHTRQGEGWNTGSDRAVAAGLEASRGRFVSGRLRYDAPAPTLLDISAMIHPVKNRWITPREGARLCGYPDSFVLAKTSDPMYGVRHSDLTQAVLPTMGRFLGGVFIRAGRRRHAVVGGTTEVVDWRKMAKQFFPRKFMEAEVG